MIEGKVLVSFLSTSRNLLGIMMFKAKLILAALVVMAALSAPAFAAGNNDSGDKADRRVAALIIRAGVHHRGSEYRAKYTRSRGSRDWARYFRERHYRIWARYLHRKRCHGHSPAGDCDNHHDNNGWGNGDQDAPGNSECNNNAENGRGNRPGSCSDGI